MFSPPLTFESGSKSISLSNQKATNLEDKQSFVSTKSVKKNDPEQYFEIKIEKMSKPNILLGFLDHEDLKNSKDFFPQPFV
jgi:hypothetical protein